MAETNQCPLFLPMEETYLAMEGLRVAIRGVRETIPRIRTNLIAFTLDLGGDPALVTL